MLQHQMSHYHLLLCRWYDICTLAWLAKLWSSFQEEQIPARDWINYLCSSYYMPRPQTSLRFIKSLPYLFNTRWRELKDAFQFASNIRLQTTHLTRNYLILSGYEVEASRYSTRLLPGEQVSQKECKMHSPHTTKANTMAFTNLQSRKAVFTSQFFQELHIQLRCAT